MSQHSLAAGQLEPPGQSRQQRRPLLPRPAPTPAQPAPLALAAAQQSSPPSRVAHLAKQSRSLRRQQVPAACGACRKRKIKCDGGRPVCYSCTQRRVPCDYASQPGETPSQALRRSYSQLRDHATSNEKILDLLRTLPDKEAHHVLQRIRSGTDISAILSHIHDGDLLLQLALEPETRFRYQFPYRQNFPENDLPDNSYLNSFVYEGPLSYAPDQRLGPDGSESDSYSLVAYQRPFHAAQVVDPRLTDVKPSLWTSVCDDDLLMRDLLGVWLRCEYQFTAAFQKDYFLEDMLVMRQDFCSSLLVNVTLAYSCVCYPRFSDRAEYWNPHTLVYRFIAEAKRIWEIESHQVRLTTIQAGMLFNVFYNLCGLDEIGQPYRIQAIELAHKLRLYDSAISGQSKRIRDGRLYTAWALYDWETLVGFSFMHAPLLKTPPVEPLPDPLEDPKWFGEIWAKYPSSQSLSPSHFGLVFHAKSQFRIIMNEFCVEAYSRDSMITLDQAYQFRSRLISWYDGLPAPLCAKTIVLPAQLQLHMYYHNLVLNMFEPLLDEETDRVPGPQQIIDDSNKHLRTLVRLYYLRHGFDAMDLFICIPLILVAFKCADAIDQFTSASQLEALRSTLILVVKGLSSQRHNHYLSEALFRVIRGRMRVQEASILKGVLNLDDEDPVEKSRAPMQAVRSAWTVSVVKEDTQVLNNLVENYAYLSVNDRADTKSSYQGG
ncbi:hypothetical protein PFICI_05736 [Pestalotiopsis fici W106-1]|uniref:Zn(2)-C6 fungal-type domain-containing protein n=1 Tax=Pestalotiopsis fici (strain W106-1 / CGMCC3.15140) TaxID=1229662 RepID=W3XCS3_PESFW|nr:uncharacterized protein PFICI_05736 [Pestalotiopsis fici W106-1]ETS83860.1 hypothetical protein PFICI_05736 [Pestalotiopsis fici W106-1]